jgi:hypothetical protein
MLLLTQQYRLEMTKLPRGCQTALLDHVIRASFCGYFLGAAALSHDLQSAL